MRIPLARLLALLLIIGLVGCGQKGPLYLPSSLSTHQSYPDMSWHYNQNSLFYWEQI